MKKFTTSLCAVLLALWGVSMAQAQVVPEGETDVTTLEWVDNGQGCVSDFNNDEGGTVFGTDSGVAPLSYVDVSDYGVIKLYGPANQTARLFINREEVGDKGIFYVEIGEDGVGVFDCNKILEAQPKAQYIHLNGVKASAWNTHLNLSLITVSGDPIEFPKLFVFPEGEVDITTLEWVNEGQGCVDNLGKETDAPIYGTHDGPTDGKLSYVDITDYASIKLYGRAGDVVRLFINRVEYPEDFQFFVTIGEDGVGAFDLAEYKTQKRAEYVHLNGVKCSWAGPAKIDYISVVKKDYSSAISIVNDTIGDDAYYTIQGVKVTTPTKGLYIHNGRKVIIK